MARLLVISWPNRSQRSQGYGSSAMRTSALTKQFRSSVSGSFKARSFRVLRLWNRRFIWLIPSLACYGQVQRRQKSTWKMILNSSRANRKKAARARRQFLSASTSFCSKSWRWSSSTNSIWTSATRSRQTTWVSRSVFAPWPRAGLHSSGAWYLVS